MSQRPEPGQVACPWCGLFCPSTKFCDFCGSPLETGDHAVAIAPPVPEESPATEGPVPEPPVTAPDPGMLSPEAFALVEDPFSLVDAVPSPAPEPIPVDEAAAPEPEAVEQLAPADPETDSVLVEATPPQTETATDDEPDQPMEPAVPPPTAAVPDEASEPDEEPADAPVEPDTSGQRCPSCSRPSRGLCEVCREAIRELSALGK